MILKYVLGISWLLMVAKRLAMVISGYSYGILTSISCNVGTPELCSNLAHLLVERHPQGGKHSPNWWQFNCGLRRPVSSTQLKLMACSKHMGGSINGGVPLVIIHFERFDCPKPEFFWGTWGTPILGNTNRSKVKWIYEHLRHRPTPPSPAFGDQHTAGVGELNALRRGMFRSLRLQGLQLTTGTLQLFVAIIITRYDIVWVYLQMMYLKFSWWISELSVSRIKVAIWRFP